MHKVFAQREKIIHHLGTRILNVKITEGFLHMFFVYHWIIIGNYMLEYFSILKLVLIDSICMEKFEKHNTLIVNL